MLEMSGLDGSSAAMRLQPFSRRFDGGERADVLGGFGAQRRG